MKNARCVQRPMRCWSSYVISHIADLKAGQVFFMAGNLLELGRTMMVDAKMSFRTRSVRA